MIMILVSVKDKICFSTLTFMKDKLRKRLMIHLYLVGTCICKIFFYYGNVPWSTTITFWIGNKN